METEIELGLRATAPRLRRGMRGARWLMVLGICGSMEWAVREAAGQTAPAPPTYIGVERTIVSIRQGWSPPGARPEPNADGWDRLFDTLLAALHAYAGAEDEASRLTALTRVNEIQAA